MSKKIIEVWVGTPKVGKYFTGGEYIDIKDKVSVYVDHTSLDNLLKSLTRIKEEYERYYHDLHFDTVRDCGCPCECDCSPSRYLKGKRHETDVEYNFRIKEEAAHQAAREQRERADFERLKSKYGGNA